MDIQFFNNGPVVFRENENQLYGNDVCIDEVAPKFCQPVKSSDDTMWQVKSCDWGDNLIQDSTFERVFDWVTGPDWVINTASNRAERSSGTAGDLSITIPQIAGVSATNEKTFEIRFNLSSFNDGGSGDHVKVYIGGAEFIEIDASILGGANQTYLVTKSINTTTDLLLRFEAEANVSFNLEVVEVRLADCADLDQQLTNPEFVNATIGGWALDTDWFYSSQEIAILKAETAILSQSSSLIIPGKFLRLEIDIVGIDATSTGSMIPRIGGIALDTFDKDTELGVYIYNFFVFNPTNTLVEFDADQLGINLEYCTLYELAAPAYIMEDCDGNFIEEFVPNNSNASNNTSHVQFEHDWSPFANGCYRFKSFDTKDVGSELVANGAINSPATEWGFGTNWSLVTNQASFSGAFSGVPLFNQVIGIVVDDYYLVNYEIVSWVDGSGGADGSMEVSLGNIEIETFVDATGVGCHTQIVSTKGLSSFDVRFSVLAGTTNLDVVVDNVSVKKLNNFRCSECFELGNFLDGAGCERTKLLTATNNDNAFGFDYINFDLIHSMRVFARLKNEAYEQLEYDAFLFDNNSVTTNFTQYRETRLLKVDFHPPYIFNALQAMSDHDLFTIEGIAYNKLTEGISPDYPPGFRVGSTDIVYYQSEQPNRINDNC